MAPGAYEERADVLKEKATKLKNYKETQEVVQFHKMRQLFPEKTSISTVQLNKIKRFEMEHVGPGTYAKSTETGPK